MIITSKVNLRTEDVILLNKTPPKKANKITIAILIKLLATKIVANSFLGRSKSFVIISMRLEFCSNPFSISVLVRENKATSAPEISAEHNRRKNSKTNPLTTEKSIAINKGLKLEGSGSK